MKQKIMIYQISKQFLEISQNKLSMFLFFVFQVTQLRRLRPEVRMRLPQRPPYKTYWLALPHPVPVWVKCLASSSLSYWQPSPPPWRPWPAAAVPVATAQVPTSHPHHPQSPWRPQGQRACLEMPWQIRLRLCKHLLSSSQCFYQTLQQQHK